MALAAGELVGDDRQPGDVVQAIPELAIGDDSGRVLHDPDIVYERQEMVGADRRQ
jgi:hypothetical protein